jgi:hypothetical protein
MTLLIIVAVMPQTCTVGAHSRLSIRACSVFINGGGGGVVRLILFTDPQLPTAILRWDPEMGPQCLQILVLMHCRYIIYTTPFHYSNTCGVPYLALLLGHSLHPKELDDLASFLGMC